MRRCVQRLYFRWDVATGVETLHAVWRRCMQRLYAFVWDVSSPQRVLYLVRLYPSDSILSFYSDAAERRRRRY